MAYIHPANARTLYVNADWSKLVPEESPEAAYVLVGPGGALSDEMARRFHLGLPGPVDETPEAAEPKQATGPAENKAIKPKANKRTK